ncbi:cytochrome P450 2J6-like isoform X1 [Asterias rubens]|uniref:cytochrome P450 2J6-like isoform X1 n=1 Tax=Asterias rubens TaxID=7604 RepID=UPI0014550565|nr:cytochrome P450 2J6-like isoform X1 [Asterias rubens]XP_033643981.1 cytochrome P450 2J6-like isoform X1 [Asterias rubens]
MDLYDVWSQINVRTVILGFTIFAFLFLLGRRPKNLPPGPYGWPLLGYIPQLAMTKEPIHDALAKLGLRYKSLMSFSVANQLIVVLQDYDVMKEAFAQHQLSGRPTLEIRQITLPGYGVLSASEGEPWTELRRFSVTTLRGLGVGKSSFEAHITTETKCLIEGLHKSKGKRINPSHMIENAVSNIICSVVFGRRFEYTDKRFQRLLSILNEMFELIGAGGVIQFVPIFAKMQFLPIVKKTISINLRLDEILSQLCYTRDTEDGGNDEDPRDFAGAFLKEMNRKKQQGVPTYLTPVTMHHTFGELFGAGTETTSTTLRWALLYMIAFPDIQSRVQKELDEAVGRNRLPRLSDKPELPFTEAVLSEIQRMGSIVPLGVPHRCTEDTILRGYSIPKGSIVITNLWNVHMDPVEWPNPEQFNPERFLDDEGRFHRREKLIPFGIGRRICLGEQLAKMELYIVFTCLLHQFTFKPPEGAPDVSFKVCDGITRAPESFELCAVAR